MVTLTTANKSLIAQVRSLRADVLRRRVLVLKRRFPELEDTQTRVYRISRILARRWACVWLLSDDEIINEALVRELHWQENLLRQLDEKD